MILRNFFIFVALIQVINVCAYSENDGILMMFEYYNPELLSKTSLNFTSHNNSVAVPVSYPFRIRCIYISENNFITLEGVKSLRTLTFEDGWYVLNGASLEQSGVYTCVLIPRNDSISVSINVTLTGFGVYMISNNVVVYEDIIIHSPFEINDEFHCVSAMENTNKSFNSWRYYNMTTNTLSEVGDIFKVDNDSFPGDSVLRLSNGSIFTSNYDGFYYCSGIDENGNDYQLKITLLANKYVKLNSDWSSCPLSRIPFSTNTSIECRGTGYPNATSRIKYFQYSNPIPQYLTDVNIDLSGYREYDSGLFICESQNYLEESSEACDITFIVPPPTVSLALSATHSQLFPGDVIDLRCTFAKHHFVDSTIKHRVIIIPHDALTTLQNNMSSQAYINSYRIIKSGNIRFECIAWIGYHSEVISESENVVINDLYLQNISNTTISVNDNNTLLLRWRVLHNILVDENYTTSIYAEGGQQPIQTLLVQCFVGIPCNRTVSIEIPDDITQSYLATIRIYNRLISEEFVLGSTIDLLAGAPKLIFSVPFDSVQVGTDRLIFCHATGNPTPMISLYYANYLGYVITANISSINTSILTPGSYNITCNATNLYGSVINTIIIEVLGINLSTSAPSTTIDTIANTLDQSSNVGLVVGAAVVAACISLFIIIFIIASLHSIMVNRKINRKRRNVRKTKKRSKKRSTNLTPVTVEVDSNRRNRNPSVISNAYNVPKVTSRPIPKPSLQSLMINDSTQSILNLPSTILSDTEDSSSPVRSPIFINPALKHDPVNLFLLHSDIVLSNNGLLLLEEFKRLGSTRIRHSVNAAQENPSKNRYKNMFPYDKCRVILPIRKEGDVDYINAAFIREIPIKTKFIAAQGPQKKPETYNEFFNMIWELSVSNIVCLSNSIEDGVMKFVRYWPELQKKRSNAPTTDHITLGDYSLQLLSENKFPQYVIRNMSIEKKGEENTKVFRQFHYTLWPERAPALPTGILRFLKVFQSEKLANEYPTVVHCSSGTGKTGVFICLYVINYLYTKGLDFSIYQIVDKLRESRTFIVQSLEQYKFTYTAVLELLLGNTDVIRRKIEVIHHTHTPQDRTGSNKFERQFKVIENLHGHSNSPEKYTVALSPDNISKNLDKTVLPLDDNRIKLEGGQDWSGGDYINATYVSSYFEEDAFIASQYPLIDSRFDFLHMCLLFKTPFIVTLLTDNQYEAITNRAHRNITQYWPNSGSTCQIGTFQVNVIQHEKVSVGLISNTLQIINLRMNKSHQLTHYILTNYSEEQDGIEDIMYIYDRIKFGQFNSETPAIVQCYDGATICGKFLCLHYLLSQLIAEGLVNIYHAVSLLRSYQPKCISDLEAYEDLHSLVINCIKYSDSERKENQETY